MALATALGASVAIQIVAGAAFEPAVPVLQILAAALLSGSLAVTGALALVSLHRHMALLLGNLAGLRAIIVLTAVLVPDYGAKGAAIAMLIADSGLVILYGVVLFGSRAVKYDFELVPRIAIAALACAAVALTPLDGIPLVVTATVVYWLVLVVLRGSRLRSSTPCFDASPARRLEGRHQPMFLVDEAGGAGRYALELVPGLLEVDPSLRLTVFVNRDAPAALADAPWASEVQWVRLPTRFSNRTHLPGQAFALPLVAAARRRLDVVHSLANGGPPLTIGAHRVVTLLDLIWLHQREAWGTPAAVRTMALLTRISARTADRVITHLGLRPRRHREQLRARAGEGGRDAARRADPGEAAAAALDDAPPVVLCVAQKRPYKNLGSLIRAVAQLPEERPTLVLPGAPTEHEAELRALADRLGVTDQVRFPAWVSDEELETLYAEATCFVLPSLIEGFGLPVLEAMARGVPVACSDRPALPEVAGDAALLFDPTDQAAVTDAVRRLIRDAGPAPSSPPAGSSARRSSPGGARPS